MTGKPPIRIYVNKTENRIAFKIKTGYYYYVNRVTSQMIKLLGSTKSEITKNENCEIDLHLQVFEAVLVHCNIVNDDYQQDLRVLYTFVPNKSFGQLLDISPTNFILLKNFYSGSLNIEVWFMAQTSKSLEIEDKVNITLVIN